MRLLSALIRASIIVAEEGKCSVQYDKIESIDKAVTMTEESRINFVSKIFIPSSFSLHIILMNI